MPRRTRRPRKRRKRGRPVHRHDLLAALIEKLTALARSAATRTLTDEQAAAIDRRIRRRVPCRMRPCREILADLEAVALAQIHERAEIVRACRAPRDPASVRTLRGAGEVFRAERIGGGVHIASVACEAKDVADAIRWGGRGRAGH
jgi:hypothetical protein